MMVTTTKFTRDDYMALPEGYPAQLIEGDLVKSPSPTYGHQRASVRLVGRLIELVGDDRVVFAPMDVFIDRHNVYQPDVLVLPEPLPADVPEVGIPCLVIEVLSPSTRRRDRRQKLDHYLEAGVAEVWFVDPEPKWIEIVTLRGDARYRGDETAESEIVPGFSITADWLFA
ncbi:MAG: Uma2 family endonuclease [Planctomycetota bacterium]